MVRQALRPNPRRQQVSRGAKWPAPVGGWDALNPLAAMPIQNAIILDNFIPRAGYVELRRGYVAQVIGFANPVESMMVARSGTTDKLFAASGGKLYDVSAAGALGAAVLSGMTSNRWNYTAFANTAGAWVIALNGSDPPQGYNAGTWAALPAITGTSPPGLTATNLFNVFAHKGRLHFLEQNTLHVWIPAAGAVGGACTLLDLSSIFSKGGRLICGANWSAQMGLTADDFAVYMTDQGQIAIYQGADPTNAADWSLIGIYDFGPPLGPKALTKFGGDLAVVTSDGVIPLSQGLKLDRADQLNVAVTRNILNAFSAAVRAYRTYYGWQATLYAGETVASQADAAGGSLLIFNVPTAVNGSGVPTSAVQFVQNTMTGAWCRFVNIASTCWANANSGIYFGTTDGVYQWDVGSSDNGKTIIGDLKGAFTDFNDGSRNKSFTMIRPLLYTTPLVQPALEVDVDYQDSEPVAMPVVVGQGAASVIRDDWTGATGLGYVGAVRMRVAQEGDTSVAALGIGDVPGDMLAVNGSGDLLQVQSGLPFDVPFQVLGFDVIYQPGGQI